MTFTVKPLPPLLDIETKPVLKQLSVAHRYLALLNGRSATIPNENILINTLSLQEAKDSSAIENIITTHDELYKAQLFEAYFNSAAAKEVNRYAEALKLGFRQVRSQKLITNTTVLKIQETLEQNSAGYRKQKGTALINEKTGETVYTPPQDHATITALMENLIAFMNDESLSDLDPLIKMSLVHHQFETIHPFYDGNGRTGRILNILFLVQQGLLDLPVLYLSRYIIQNKGDYYKLLQSVRDTGDWEPWLLYMLKGVEETSKQAIALIDGIHKLMQEYKQRIRSEHSKIYSQDLLNNLFKHPYTKIEFLMEDLQVSRQTASTYLDTLVSSNFLIKHKIGKSNYYMNMPLFTLFKDGIKQAQEAETIITKNTER